MMKQFGISYKAAGHNIAMGQRAPEIEHEAVAQKIVQQPRFLLPKYF